MATANRQFSREFGDRSGMCFRELFLVDGRPMRRLAKAIPPIVRRTGYLNVAKDLVKGVRAL